MGRMSKRRSVAIAAMAAAAASLSSHQARASGAGPFSQGSIGVSILLGNASVGDKSYLILGAGAGYYLIDGLEIGLEGSTWLLEDPRINTLTPQAKYVLYFVPVIKPYVGTFYSHYFIGGGFDDQNSVGGRVGGYWILGGGGSYLGVGAVYEHFLGCDDAVVSCDDWYPEVSLGLSF